MKICKDETKIGFVGVKGCTAYNLCVKVTCESLYKTFCLTLSAVQLCSTSVPLFLSLTEEAVTTTNLKSK